MIKFDFTSNMHPEIVQKMQVDHKLKLSLLKDLRLLFDSLYPQERLSKITAFEKETDAFQRWLNSTDADLQRKVEVLKSVYYKANEWNKAKQLKDGEAIRMIHDGFLSIQPVGAAL